MGTLLTYDRLTWKTMLNLKKDIEWYKDQNDPKYSAQIKKDKAVFRYLVNQGLAA